MIKTLTSTEVIPALYDFFYEWQKLSNKNLVGELNTRLEEFIDKWQHIGWHPETAVPAKEIVVSELDTFIKIAEPAVTSIRNASRNGESSNVWEVAGLKRDEVGVSSVLAWFFNPHGEHGQGPALLSALVKRINSQYPEIANYPQSEHISEKPYWVSVESCPDGERESRVDIEIEGEQFLLFIELKIDAPETNNQIERYLEIGAKKSHSRPWLVVFLNPAGKKPVKSPDHPNLVTISWKDIYHVFRIHAKSLDDSFSKNMIKQFAKFISQY